MSRRALALVPLALGALLLAACAPGTAGAGGDTATGVPAPPLEAGIDVEAAWLDGGRSVAVVTWGSSSCVPVAEDVKLEADGGVAVSLRPADAEVCTADYAPRATLVGLPAGASAGDALNLVVTLEDARGETSLGAYAGGDVAEYTPSAGWAGDDLIAILTWGSSSCAPVVESVEETSASAVSVVFADPGTKPCTMDMAPRVALVGVADVAHDAATLTLSGGGAEFADPVTLPVS
ncbi:hypothetical protein [Microbacterium sp. No. 7]|uniref:hypothetical protein n=1 Tax=Microbacterium sp. No. 7 TaxID=1714373 RepID=UPI0006D1342F|nr:hypothetical protein [Microbacterium sp. No. 7]ALJ22002.1 hypothetical protein AOA12_19735 [Microbacterium sp. No. 7]